MRIIIHDGANQMKTEIVIYEVHLGHDLFFDEPTLLADGWYWNWGHETAEDSQGPFPDLDAALNAADEASSAADTELHIVDIRGTYYPPNHGHA
jgi:hypothetical protein